MDTNQKSKDLLNRYLQNNCTERERALVESWYLKETEIPSDSEIPIHMDMSHKDLIWQSIDRANKAKAQSFSTIKMIAAAILLFILGISFWIMSNRFFPENATGEKDLLTKTLGKVTLINAEGQQFDLSKGTVKAELEKAGLTLTENPYTLAQAQYKVMSITNNEVKTSRLVTGKGETTSIQLLDGSTVWLNASSTLEFSVSDTKQTYRNVTLQGEAYFKVAKDKDHPFRVHSNGQTVEVLGTEFNVSSYADDPTFRTTLVEGSVKIDDVTLRPGQQAEWNNGNIKVREVSVDNEITWRQGYFIFEGETIESVMQKLSRWYDFDVKYVSLRSKNERVNGTITYSAKLEDILIILEKISKVKFKKEGRLIIIN